MIRQILIRDMTALTSKKYSQVLYFIYHKKYKMRTEEPMGKSRSLSKRFLADQDEYVKALSFKQDPGLIDLKTKLIKELKNKNSQLNTYLKISLSKEEKSTLICALLTCNQDKIVELLTPALKNLKLGKSISFLKRIPENEEDDPDDEDVFSESATEKMLLNEVVSALIRSMLTDEKGARLALADGATILQQVVYHIPDSTIDPSLKSEICKEIDKLIDEDTGYSSYIFDYSHHETSVIHRFSGLITEKEYVSAMKSTNIDNSEFILLTLGSLQNELKLDEAVIHELNEIRYLYLKTDYEKAIEKLRNLCKENKSTINSSIFNIIMKQSDSKSTSLKEENIYDNHSRRFFENRIAQLYLRKYTKNKDNLDRINRFSVFFLGRKVETLEQAENAMLDVTITILDKKALKSLKDKSSHYQKKDRSIKPGFISKEILTMKPFLKQNDQVYSSNSSVFKSTSPNFRHEINEEVSKNRVVDYTELEPGSQGYPYMRKRSPYVASLSGHIFTMVQKIEKYIEHFSEILSRSELNQDVNIILKTYISSYIDHGFHSYLELQDVLEEPAIQELFVKYDITLETWPTDIIEQSSKDAQEYAKGLCLKKAMHEEMLPELKTAVQMSTKLTIKNAIVLQVRLNTIITNLQEFFSKIEHEQLYPAEKEFLKSSIAIANEFNLVINSYNKGSYFPVFKKHLDRICVKLDEMLGLGLRSALIAADREAKEIDSPFMFFAAGNKVASPLLLIITNVMSDSATMEAYRQRLNDPMFTDQLTLQEIDLGSTTKPAA